MISKIAIAYNSKNKAIPKGKPKDLYAEFDSLETVKAIKKAILKYNPKYKVALIEADENCYEKFQKEKPYAIFNIAEGLHGRSREAQIPLLLEMLDIPYSGSGPLTLALCLDKAKTKEILQYHKIPTPQSQVINNIWEKISKNLRFPLIVKLLYEGSSMGLSEKNIVKNYKELARVLKKLFSNYKEPVLVEEFLTGKELTVGIIGNPPRIMGMIEIYFDKYPRHFDILSYEAKGVRHDDAFSGKPRISKELQKKICAIALETHAVLGCRDFSRVDVRCDKKGNPYIIEINPLPGLSPSMEHISFFPKIARINGINYDKLVSMMLSTAARRIKTEKLHLA